MTSIADKALLIRIQNKDNKLEPLIVTVMRSLEVSDVVLEALDQRIASSLISWIDLLPYLKKYSRNKLFEVFYERFPPGRFDAAELFKMGYGKEYFEDPLCRELYDTSKGKGLGMYSYIFEALSEHGGPKSLEMMEVIKHELFPAIKTNRIVADAIRDGFSEENGFSDGEFKPLLDDKFYSDFFPRLESAIERLRLRGIQLPDESPNDETSSIQNLPGRVQRVEHFKNTAVELLPKYPAEALTNMRKAAEAICKDVLDAAFQASSNPNRKPAARSSLEDMINRMRKDGLVPTSIESCLGSLQSFGNFASHDQEENPQAISVEMAESTLGHLKTVIEWYRTLDFNTQQASK